MTAAVIAQDHGTRRDLTLSRPERGNCLSQDMVAALGSELDRAAQDGVRLLVFRGAGRHFCTGFDLSDLDTVNDAQLLARFVAIEMLLARIWSAPLETAVAAQGRIVGAGADLFACCSMRIATPDASFAFPGAGFGLILGTRRLGQRIGPDLAADMIRTGRQMKCDEGQLAGLVTHCASEDQQDIVLEHQAANAGRLDVTTTAQMRAVLGADAPALDGDLAALVRSAARPGLCDRIRAFREKTRAENATRKKEMAS